MSIEIKQRTDGKLRLEIHNEYWEFKKRSDLLLAIEDILSLKSKYGNLIQEEDIANSERSEE
jgi:hypothetical protein